MPPAARSATSTPFTKCTAGIPRSSRLDRQEDHDRRVRQEGTNLGRIVENETGEEEDTEDDEGDGDEIEIWSVTHVTEEDFETTEGQTEDLYSEYSGHRNWQIETTVWIFVNY